MSEVTSTGSLKTIFKFPFQGEGWQNRLITGIGLCLAGFIIPIVPLIFVYGYVLKIMRQAIQGEEPALPAWDDWGGLAMDGLRFLVVNFVYMLPATAVFFGGWGLYMGTFMTFLPMLNSASAGEAAAMSSGMFASIGIMFLSMFLGSLLLILGGVPLPMATAHLAAQGSVASAFRVGEWWRLLRANKLGYFIAWVVFIGLGGLLYTVCMMLYSTFILCCLIPFAMAPAIFYLALVGGALFGQVYRESTELAKEKTAEETPTAE